MTNLKDLWQFDICLTVSQPLCHNHCVTTTVSQPLCHDHCVPIHCEGPLCEWPLCDSPLCEDPLCDGPLCYNIIYNENVTFLLETDDRQKNMGLWGCTAEVQPKNMTLLKITNFVLLYLLTSKKDFFDKNQESATWTSFYWRFLIFEVKTCKTYFS